MGVVGHYNSPLSDSDQCVLDWPSCCFEGPFYYEILLL